MSQEEIISYLSKDFEWHTAYDIGLATKVNRPNLFAALKKLKHNNFYIETMVDKIILESGAQKERTLYRLRKKDLEITDVLKEIKFLREEYSLSSDLILLLMIYRELKKIKNNLQTEVDYGNNKRTNGNKEREGKLFSELQQTDKIHSQGSIRDLSHTSATSEADRTRARKNEYENVGLSKEQGKDSRRPEEVGEDLQGSGDDIKNSSEGMVKQTEV